MVEQDIKKVIQLAISGDKVSAGRLYSIYFDPIYRYIYSRVRVEKDAEDIVQDVFLKMYKNLPNLSFDQRGLLPYLYTIARTTLVDFIKKKKPILSDDLDFIVDPESGPEQLSVIKEEKNLVFKLLESFPDDKREIIKMRYILDLSYSEIAKMVGKSEEAVRQILSRAIGVMKENLKKYEK